MSPPNTPVGSPQEYSHRFRRNEVECIQTKTTTRRKIEKSTSIPEYAPPLPQDVDDPLIIINSDSRAFEIDTLHASYSPVCTLTRKLSAARAHPSLKPGECFAVETAIDGSSALLLIDFITEKVARVNDVWCEKNGKKSAISGAILDGCFAFSLESMFLLIQDTHARGPELCHLNVATGKVDRILQTNFVWGPVYYSRLCRVRKVK